jgi:hypothetical protein
VFLSVLFVFGCLLVVLHGDSSMDYVSIQFSVNLLFFSVQRLLARSFHTFSCMLHRTGKYTSKPHHKDDIKQLYGTHDNEEQS